MRLFRLLPALSLLGAFASPFDSREPAPSTLLARDLDDRCANIDTQLTVPKIGILFPVGKIGESILILQLMSSDISERSTDICLCLSQVVDFVKKDAVAILAIAIVGEDAVIQVITDLVC